MKQPVFGKKYHKWYIKIQLDCENDICGDTHGDPVRNKSLETMHFSFLLFSFFFLLVFPNKKLRYYQRKNNLKSPVPTSRK